MTEDEQREPFLRWVIRHVTVPVLIALIGLVGVLVVRNGGEAGPSTTAATPTTAAPTIVVPPARGRGRSPSVYGAASVGPNPYHSHDDSCPAALLYGLARGTGRCKDHQTVRLAADSWG
jgi:hypothetical protein